MGTHLSKESHILMLAKSQLEHDIRKDIYTDLMNTFVEEFKERIKPIIRENVKQVTLGHIDCYKNLLDLASELRVKVNIDFSPDEAKK